MKFRTKPLEVEAFQLCIGQDMDKWPTWMHQAIALGPRQLNGAIAGGGEVTITTPSGRDTAMARDWIVRDQNGHLRIFDAVTFGKVFEQWPPAEEPKKNTEGRC